MIAIETELCTSLLELYILILILYKNDMIDEYIYIFSDIHDYMQRTIHNLKEAYTYVYTYDYDDRNIPPYFTMI